MIGNSMKRGVPRSELIHEFWVHVISNSSKLKTELGKQVAAKYDISPRKFGDLALRAGRRLSNSDRTAQIKAIYQLNAICCGFLVGSITVRPTANRGGTSRFEVSTNLAEDYPYYLIKGRSSTHSHHGSAFRMSLRCGKQLPNYTGSGRFSKRLYENSSENFYNRKHENNRFVFTYKIKGARPKDYVRLADSIMDPQVCPIVWEEIHNAFGR